MTRRIALIAVGMAAAFALLATGVSGCQRPTVAVKTGERVVCTYGEEVTSTVRTIRVQAGDAGKYSVSTRRITCPRHQQLEKLYSEAQAALTKQDFKTAEKKLAELVAIDATYKRASEQLADLKAGKKPGADTSSGSTSGSTATTGTTPASGGSTTTETPDEPDEPEGPVASLLAYTPDTIKGFRAYPVKASTFSVARQYVPTSASTLDSFTIVAEQYRSDRAAKEWLDSSIKRGYSQSARTGKIGNRTAYFGTDGQRFAVIAWTNGQVGVAIEGDVGSKPADGFAALSAIVGALPK